MAATVIPLEQIPITRPCPLPAGAVDHRSKLVYCAACRQNVHNLSLMTADDARRVVCDAAFAHSSNVSKLLCTTGPLAVFGLSPGPVTIVLDIQRGRAYDG